MEKRYPMYEGQAERVCGAGFPELLIKGAYAEIMKRLVDHDA